MRPETIEELDARARDIVLPLLMYKSIFLGEWYGVLIREERDPDRRRTLVKISAETRREADGIIEQMREWKGDMLDPESVSEFVSELHELLLRDLMRVKDGSAEVIVHAAMRAPTARIRDRLMDLAMIDRDHSQALRAILAGARDPDRARKPTGTILGAHEGRSPHKTLGESLRDNLEQLESSGERAARLTLSAEAVRHARDEGLVSADGRIFGIPVDVDLAWRAECYALHTDERFRLAEMMGDDSSPT